MIILNDIEQGSKEWFAARAGVVTMSELDKIITTTGKESAQAKKYMYLKAGEKMIGTCESGYTNHHMDRGKELEAEARGYYELVNDVEVQEVGLCYKDETKRVSCSPDGLIGDDGGLEIKCRSLAIHMENLDKNKLPTGDYCQVQGSLWVTGRKWWSYLSYYPGAKQLLIRVEPDFAFHRKIEVTVNSFLADLDELVERLANS